MQITLQVKAGAAYRRPGGAPALAPNLLRNLHHRLPGARILVKGGDLDDIGKAGAVLLEHAPDLAEAVARLGARVAPGDDIARAVRSDLSGNADQPALFLFRRSGDALLMPMHAGKVGGDTRALAEIGDGAVDADHAELVKPVMAMAV